MLLLLLEDQLATEECQLIYKTLRYPISVTISIKYPINSFLNYYSLFDNFKHTIMLISSTKEPQNYEEVITHPSWVQAMKEELKALKDNKSWSITELPLGKTAIGCHWMYKVKHKAKNSIERYKTRLVAKSYTKIEGLDFLGTFAFIAKLTTLRLLLALLIPSASHLDCSKVLKLFTFKKPSLFFFLLQLTIISFSDGR